ncbi:MAG: hypothetical protein KAV87_53300 [Desulfobacteraceae bacterium]|nr:hypothetical protein [Desulfobacteraceae bacterium]
MLDIKYGKPTALEDRVGYASSLKPYEAKLDDLIPKLYSKKNNLIPKEILQDESLDDIIGSYNSAYSKRKTYDYSTKKYKHIDPRTHRLQPIFQDNIITDMANTPTGLKMNSMGKIVPV